MQHPIQIGVFWFIDGRIYGQAETVSVRAIGARGLTEQHHRFIDSSLEHWRLWETSSLRATFAPHEYYEFSRGRVLYDQQLSRHRVYCDAALLAPSVKAVLQTQLRAFFGLNEARLSLFADEHYTTDRAHLNRLFEG